MMYNAGTELLTSMNVYNLILIRIPDSDCLPNRDCDQSETKSARQGDTSEKLIERDQ